MRPHYCAVEVARACGVGYDPTPEQAAVVEAHPARPLLVVAGAGSGKTETMAARVVWLVANGFVEPDQVLGLTFTRKAATELAERIGHRLRRLRAAGMWVPAPDDAGAEVLGGTPTVSTYHAYAGRLVREHALRLGYEPESRLLSEAAAWQYAAEAVGRYDGPMDEVDYAESTVVAAVVDLAGEIAEHLLTTDEVRTHLDEVLAAIETTPWAARQRTLPLKDVHATLRARRAVLPLVEAYLRLKRSRDAMDFADQVVLAARLARSFPAIGHAERSRFRAVLLDEFQDTSEAQLTLLRSLFVATGCPVPVTAVGDPNQSIYGWRGASATTLTRFPEEFRDTSRATVLPLSTSWRNDTAVLEAANATSAPLRGLSVVPVRPLAARPAAGPGLVEAARLSTHLDEAAFVARWLRQHRSREGVSAAVLCRKRSQFGPVVEALEEAGVPFEVVGLGGLLLTPEVEDLVALLRVIEDPARGDGLMRVLTGPLCRLGAADLDGLMAWAVHRQGVSRRHDRGELALELTGDAPGGPDDDTRGLRELAPDAVDEPSIVEALDDLPRSGWTGPHAQRLSDCATARLGGLSRVVRRLRGLTSVPLAELVGEAERALGLDIEVLSRPEYTPAAARAHLDAFADVAAQFTSSADRPTLGGFLAWLDAALSEERGLDKGYIEASPDAVQVLTIHAAKGLEWDVVAVPGLVEGTFPARTSATRARWDAQRQRWRVPPPQDSGWCSGLAGVPYALRGDADGLPELVLGGAADSTELRQRFERFRTAGGQHELREERRLAYVAVTRARRKLLLTASVWTTAKEPRVTSPFLDELVEDETLGVRCIEWHEMPAPDAVGTQAPDAPPPVLWPADPLAERRRLVQVAEQAVREAQTTGDPPDPRDPRVREAEILLAERAAAGPRAHAAVEVPRHLSTSAVVSLAADRDRFALQLRRPMPAPPATAARRGTAFHAWVEQHFARAAMVDVLDLPGSADDDLGDDADLPRMKELFLASDWADRIPEAVEVSVETMLAGFALRGRVDAVFPRDDGGYTVVDWKTGAEPSGAEAGTRAIQLGAYALAYARLRGLPASSVDGAFYYARTGRTAYPALPGEAELLALLASVPD